MSCLGCWIFTIDFSEYSSPKLFESSFIHSFIHCISISWAPPTLYHHDLKVAFFLGSQHLYIYIHSFIQHLSHNCWAYSNEYKLEMSQFKVLSFWNIHFREGLNENNHMNDLHHVLLKKDRVLLLSLFLLSYSPWTPPPLISSCE